MIRNDYDYLIKFILIGDTSNNQLTQMWASRACSCAYSRTGSGASMSRPWESSLAPRCT